MEGMMRSQEANVVAAPPGVFGARILDLADRLARWSETPDGLTCTYLTEAHRAAAGQLREWLQAAGMQVSIDALGNITGHYPSANAGAKTLLVGSHYDTVHSAGKYDGRLGILAPLVVIEQLAREGRRLPFHLDLICFSEEEGVRFGTSYIGSSAVAGRFDMAVLDRCDANGVSVRELVRAAGGDLSTIPAIARRPNDLLGYLELHIEQGPVLLRENLPIGIVTAIAGSIRRLVTITGKAGHAGTVPMTQRQDAAAAAAEMVLAVETRCRQAPGTVGTVGQLAVPDGAINVIPGRCELSVDIRADDTAKRDAAVADVFTEFERIGKRRGVTVEITEVQRSPVVVCSPRMQERLAAAIARAGLCVHTLASGAGHDAVMFDGVTESAMLFVRCGNGGISHSPLETITAEDADVAARVLLDVLLHFEE
jgi:beta-ureidopropionase / N-carbamoyl-L-amino-acid hydrolase